MACDALVFGTPQGVLNATFTGNAEAIRHEVGTADGLECDCEMVLRSTQSITLATDSLGNGGPVAVAASDFIIPGVAVCTSLETSYSRDNFVQDSATYDLITSDVACTGVEATADQQDPGSCPGGWSTIGSLVNGTYSEARELLRHEETTGDGSPGNPLLEINAIYLLRTTITMSATIEEDPVDWDGLVVVEGTPSNYSDIAGCRVTITLSSADAARTNTATGIVTSCEMSKQREGFATYTITLESQNCTN
jgi:hypothetical protein